MSHSRPVRSGLSSSVYSQPTAENNSPVQRHQQPFPPQSHWSPAAASSILEEAQGNDDDDVDVDDDDADVQEAIVRPARHLAVPYRLQPQLPPSIIISPSTALDNGSRGIGVDNSRRGQQDGILHDHVTFAGNRMGPENVPPYTSAIHPPQPAGRQRGGEGSTLHHRSPGASDPYQSHRHHHHHPHWENHSHASHHLLRFGPHVALRGRSHPHHNGHSHHHHRKPSYGHGQSPGRRRSSPSWRTPQRSHHTTPQSFSRRDPDHHYQSSPPPPNRSFYLSHFSPSSHHPPTLMGTMATFNTEGTNKAPNFEDLFFDLLFVANLAVYSGTAELSSMVHLRFFLGFFVLLWWTWYTHSLFDVRFRTRFGMRKGRFLYIWQIAMRIYTIGTYVAFTTTASTFSRGDFRSFSKIYALNRFSLALDFTGIAIDTLREEWWGTGGMDHSTGGTSVTRTVKRSVGPLVGAGVNAGTCLIWALASRLPMDQDHHRPTRFIVWFLSTVFEISMLFVAEWKCQFTSLRHTHICERLALFAIVILGEGFSSLGQTLNSLSPGLKIKTRDHSQVHSVRNDGWSADVVMQTASSVLILCSAFITYYRDAALELKSSTSLVILTWSVLHVIYFAATGLLVVGLKRIIQFHNTHSALVSFLKKPSHYLPFTPFYAHVNETAVAGLLGKQKNGKVYTLPESDGFTTAESHVYAVVSVIQGFSGAWIPSVAQALAIIKTTGPILTTDIGPTMKYQLSTLVQFSETLKKVQTLDGLVLDHLFEYEYVYCSVAIVYICDCLIKGIQAGRGNLRNRVPTLTIRFCTGLVLVGFQILFVHYRTSPSWALINGGLPILASIMLVEIATQMAMEWYLIRGRLRRDAKDDEATIAFWREKADKGGFTVDEDLSGGGGGGMGYKEENGEDKEVTEAVAQGEGVTVLPLEAHSAAPIPHDDDDGGTMEPPAAAAAAVTSASQEPPLPPLPNPGGLAAPKNYYRRASKLISPRPYDRF